VSLSVIIPSKTVSNLIPSAEAVWRNEDPRTPIVVVDDGLVPASDDARAAFSRWDRENCPVWIHGDKPFVFARNVNKGIRKAGNSDVVLLNDDAMLQTPGGFSLLQRAAAENPEYGVIAATGNNVGNRNQCPQGIGLRSDPRIVCFIAVLIPRRTIELVGLLDERFVGYGFEDDDYCLRVRRAGLKIGIHDGCYVDHGSLKSTFRGNPAAPADLSLGMKIFVEKWGAHPL
jgi:O-antigen biosynthesis protein